MGKTQENTGYLLVLTTNPDACFVVVIVYLTCEFIISLAVGHKSRSPAPVMGLWLTQRAFFTASFYFYCVMT